MSVILDEILSGYIHQFNRLRNAHPEKTGQALLDLMAQDLDQCPYCIVVSDVDLFRPAYLNKACRQFTDIKYSQLKNLNNSFYYKFVHAESHQIVSLGVAHFMSQPQKPYYVCYKLVPNSKESRWAYLATHTLSFKKTDPGSMEFMISAFIDIPDVISSFSDNISHHKRDIHNDMSIMLESLTKREREMLLLIGEEHSVEKISEIMNVAPNTVKTYRQNIMEKLGVKSGVGLGKFACALACEQ